MLRSMMVMGSLLISVCMAAPAVAQAKGYAGVLVGMSVPDYDDTSARPIFGFLGGARLDGELGIGGFYLTSSKDETINNQETKFNYDLYGLEGSFHFEGVADGAYIAARVGLAKVSTAAKNYSPMVWGINFGYDYFIKESFSLGAEGGFMSVASEKKGAFELDKFTMLNFLVAAKFWF